MGVAKYAQSQNDIQNRGVYAYVMNTNIIPHMPAERQGIVAPSLPGALPCVALDSWLRYPREDNAIFIHKLEKFDAIPISPRPGNAMIFPSKCPGTCTRH